MRPFESDAGFYYGVGVFTLVVFVASMAVVALVWPEFLGARELAGFFVGYLVFVAVYVVSMSVARLEDGDGA